MMEVLVLRIFANIPAMSAEQIENYLIKANLLNEEVRQLVGVLMVRNDEEIHILKNNYGKTGKLPIEVYESLLRIIQLGVDNKPFVREYLDPTDLLVLYTVFHTWRSKLCSEADLD